MFLRQLCRMSVQIAPMDATACPVRGLPVMSALTSATAFEGVSNMVWSRCVVLSGLVPGLGRSVFRGQKRLEQRMTRGGEWIRDGHTSPGKPLLKVFRQQ